MKGRYLANINTGKVIEIQVEGGFWVVGFSSKKDLLKAVGTLEYDEEVRVFEITEYISIEENTTHGEGE